MTQEERRTEMQERILSAACHEFGCKTYEGASVNLICEHGKFSKGVLYHYYPSKDDLFLGCVDHCFQSLTSYCITHLPDPIPCSQEVVNTCFQCRYDFFLAFPDLEKIFSRVLANPPVHLIKQISALRRPFDELNYRLLSGLVTHKKRLASMPLSDILALMELYQSYCNRSQQMREAVKQGMQACEELRQNYLDAFLHGVLND